MWIEMRTVDNKPFWQNGWNEIWLEGGKYNLYSYGPSKGERMDLLATFDTLEEAQNHSGRTA
jgi:hypothetical protein